MKRGCRFSTNATHGNVHEEHATTSASFDHSPCDIATDNNEWDANSFDSGLNVSQESTIGSGNELMVTNPHRVPLFVRETLSSADGEKGKFVQEENCETFRKNQAVVTEADVLWKVQKREKVSPGHERRSYTPKPSIKHLQDDFAVDSTVEKIPVDKSNACASSDFDDNTVSGYSSEWARHSSLGKDLKDEVKTCCDRQGSSVEDLFTKRKLSAEDEQLLTSRPIDDIIQVRRSLTAVTPDVRDDESTAAKHLVESTATAANRCFVTVHRDHCDMQCFSSTMTETKTGVE